MTNFLLPQKTLIMKFGGAALATPQQFSSIAQLVIQRSQEYQNIVIVVSAMGKSTDQLIDLAKAIHPHPPRREYDMLLTVGERISMALLAMALSYQGKEAISYTGSQSGIITSSHHTEAHIVEIKPQRILKSLNEGKLVIVAGFQGVSRQGEITTLGRGGSDTTAVSLAIALKAEKVEFYKDVPGIFTEDPKNNPFAVHLQEISYEEALKIVKSGARILHDRCLKLAQANYIPLHVLSFNEDRLSLKGTFIPGKSSDQRPYPVLEEELVNASHLN